MDAFIWPQQKQGIYSTKSGYNWLISHSNPNFHATDSWSWIWRLKVPEKFKFLIWLACHNVVPTLSLLHHRNMVNSAICSRCAAHEESLFHCLRDCNFSIAIWNNIGFSSQAFFSSISMTEWLREGSSCPRSAIFLAGLWWIWRHRNNMCLNNTTLSEFQLRNNIFRLADTITKAFKKETNATPSPRLIRWNNNNCQCTILNVDGSCSGDPIRAGFGGVFVTTREHTLLATRDTSLSHKTSCLLNLRRSIMGYGWQSV